MAALDRQRFWLCRRPRHHDWDDTVEIAYEGSHRHERTWRHHVSKRCTNCGTICHEFLDVFGEVEYRTYIYPDGYQYSGDEEPPTAAELRLWRIKTKGRT